MQDQQKEWARPEIAEFDIAEKTQADPFAGSDLFGAGRDPAAGGGGGGGIS